MSKIISLMNKIDDSRYQSLEQACVRVEARAKEMNTRKGIVIALKEDFDDYTTTYELAGLTNPQALALLERIKHRIQKQMDGSAHEPHP